MDNGLCNITIHNVPVNEKNRYVVARYDGVGKYWYWGSWNKEEDARKVAEMIDGIVCEKGDDNE